MRENLTKIKYISVFDKIYKVTDISFSSMTISATESTLQIADVLESEVFDIGTLSEFRIKFKNLGGRVIDLQDWKNRH